MSIEYFELRLEEANEDVHHFRKLRNAWVGVGVGILAIGATVEHFTHVHGLAIGLALFTELGVVSMGIDADMGVSDAKSRRRNAESTLHHLELNQQT